MPTVEVGGKQSDFCSKQCSTAALSRVPMILEVPSGNAKYEDVVNQFTEKWKHPTQVPTVVKLWRIYGDRAVLDRFSRYQLELERRTGHLSGNTRRRFHGTIRACRLGDTSSDSALCQLRACNMCRIIQSSFQLARAGERTNFGRFGAGIYTSATSSKANDYYVGNAVKLTVTDQTLTKPPVGYDSVIGEPGGDLNYDECIVYNNEAIRASYLIVYK
ncbi:ADP-ribosylation [Russula compacta]|nr:ADP-ribosylation [Russula compacta]